VSDHAPEHPTHGRPRTHGEDVSPRMVAKPTATDPPPGITARPAAPAQGAKRPAQAHMHEGGKEVEPGTTVHGAGVGPLGDHQVTR
jgi:hypothetical protein